MPPGTEPTWVAALQAAADEVPAVAASLGAHIVQGLINGLMSMAGAVAGAYPGGGV